MRGRVLVVALALAAGCGLAAAAHADEVLVEVSKETAKGLFTDFVATVAKNNAIFGTVISAGAASTLTGALFVYKATDFSLDVGLAAVDREDRTLGADLILVNGDAALLRGLRAQGADLNTDPRALEAKRRLTGQMNRLGETEQSPYRFALQAVGNHLPYAVTKAVAGALAKAIEGQAGERLGRLGGALGDELAFMTGNRSAFASGLRYLGWRKLGERSRMVKAYTDKLVAKLIESALDQIVKQQIDAAFRGALDNLYKEVMEQHPSRPAAGGRVRRLLLSSPQVYARVALPMVATAAPVPAELAPIPATARPADPVVQMIYEEDRYFRRSGGGSSPSSSPAPEPSAAQSAPEPRPRTPPRMPRVCGASWDGNSRSRVCN